MLSFPTKFALILEEKTKTTNRDRCLHCSLCACKSQHKDLENETILGRGKKKKNQEFSTPGLNSSLQTRSISLKERWR